MSPRETFLAELKALNAPLPWTETGDGGICDANGDFVLQVDPENERADASTIALALWVVLAVNTCGGFKAVAP